MRTPLRPPWQVRVLVGDGALALFFACVVVLGRPFEHDEGVTASVWLGLLTVVPLAFRRTTPALALAGTTALLLGPSLVIPHYVPFFFGNIVPAFVVVYTFARRSGSQLARWMWASGFVVMGVMALRAPEARGVNYVLFDGLTFGAAWLAGRTMRRFDVQGDALTLALSALTEEQVVRERSAIAAERSRIAAEMHDVVAHAVSLMVVEVGATRIKLEKDGRSRQGLAAIEDAGREALTGLRRMLGVLREPVVGTPNPLPGLAELPELIAHFTGIGLDVHLDIEPLGELPASAQLATYRILQDALDNALTHGAADKVTARVRRRADQLVIDVSNPVAHGRANTRGPRRIGERVALFRGSLGTDRRQDRFEVHVELPVGDPTKPHLQALAGLGL